MELYSAYHLTIASELPLPELMPSADEPDVYIRLRALQPLNTPPSTTQEAYMGETEYGRFIVNEGHEIIFDPTPGTNADLWRPIILGPALALLLRLRGLLALHASSVAIQDVAIAFIGNSGWGKSTLAKAFYDRGHPLVTDDVLAIDLAGDQPLIVPSCPLIKLWPNSLTMLGNGFDHFAKMHTQTEKLVSHLTKGFHTNALLLKRLYILGQGEQVAIHKLTAQDAFANLMAHSWGNRSLTAKQHLHMHMEQCGRLLNQVSVRRLERPHDLTLLPQVIERIYEDLAEV